MTRYTTLSLSLLLALGTAFSAYAQQVPPQEPPTPVTPQQVISEGQKLSQDLTNLGNGAEAEAVDGPNVLGLTRNMIPDLQKYLTDDSKLFNQLTQHEAAVNEYWKKYVQGLSHRR
jgi:hypothetical protein